MAALGALVTVVATGACDTRVPPERLQAAAGRLSAPPSVPAAAQRGANAADGASNAAPPIRASGNGAAPGSAAARGAVDTGATGAGSTPTAGASGGGTRAGSAASAGPGVRREPTGAAGAGNGGARPAGPAGAGPGIDPGDPGRGGPVPPAAGKSVVVLGSFGTASGVIGAQVAAIPPATRAWLADVNARGGLSGHPVKVVFGDDRGDPQQALSLVRRMVEQDGAIAFVATYTVTTMESVAPYLEARNVPIIGATGGSEVEDTSPMIFNPTLGADHGIAWSYLLTIAAQTDKRKLSIFYCREAATCQNQVRRIKELAPRLPGFSVVHEAQVSIVQPDYTAEVLAARNAGAEIVVTVMDAASTIRVLRSAHRQGWKPIVSATHNLNSASFRTGDAELDGTLAASTTVPYTTSARLAPYREAMQRYQPGAPLGGYGASAWAHALLVERLTAAWAQPQPTSRDVVEALYGLRRETIGGLIVPVTFNRGPHRAVNLCVVPVRYEDGMFRPPGGGDGTFSCPPGYVAGDPAASQAAVS